MRVCTCLCMSVRLFENECVGPCMLCIMIVCIFLCTCACVHAYVFVCIQNYITPGFAVGTIATIKEIESEKTEERQRESKKARDRRQVREEGKER